MPSLPPSTTTAQGPSFMAEALNPAPNQTLLGPVSVMVAVSLGYNSTEDVLYRVWRKRLAL